MRTSIWRISTKKERDLFSMPVLTALLHRAGCEAVTAMVATKFRKEFFLTYDEAKSSLDKKYGLYMWATCGYCNPF
jgi:hypothetical protein